MIVKKTSSDPIHIRDSFQISSLNYKFSIGKIKSAGVIPYCYHNNSLMILLQKIDEPKNKKLKGWNDFGGSSDRDETVYDIAAREFSEETSGVIYVNECEKESLNVCIIDTLMKDTKKIIETIVKSKQHYVKRIRDNPKFVCINDSYVSFLINVEYIDVKLIPAAEDMHIHYADRYYRTCKWFPINELMELDNSEFHRRLSPKVLKKYLSSNISKLN